MTVPLTICQPYDPVWKQRLSLLGRTGTTDVLLIVPHPYERDLPPLSYFEQATDYARAVIPMLSARGYQVGIWIGHTLGHGGALSAGDDEPYQSLVASDLKEIPGCYCPLDQRAFKHWASRFGALPRD